jgi:hypothetical protein
MSKSKVKKPVKESFKYQYTRPCLDWFEYVPIEIKPDDYYYFKLERRFGPSWWIIGTNPVDEPKRHWEEKVIGEIDKRTLLNFIKWCETEYGSKITEIHAISGSFNIIKEIESLLKTAEGSK